MVVQGQRAKVAIHYKSWTTCGVQDLEVMEMPFGSSSPRKGRQDDFFLKSCSELGGMLVGLKRPKQLDSLDEQPSSKIVLNPRYTLMRH